MQHEAWCVGFCKRWSACAPSVVDDRVRAFPAAAKTTLFELHEETDVRYFTDAQHSIPNNNLINEITQFKVWFLGRKDVATYRSLMPSGEATSLRILSSLVQPGRGYKETWTNLHQSSGNNLLNCKCRSQGHL